MSEPFLGEIIMFGGNFAPRGWAFCDGQLISIAQNSALFSILGTTYGGDGRTTFGLPEMRGRTPVHSGNGSAGPGLTPRPLGQRGGQEFTIQNVGQMANHNHTGSVAVALPTAGGGTAGLNATGAQFAGTADANIYVNGGTPGRPMASNTFPATIGAAGASQSQNNMQPFLAVNFIIAMQGIFPSRS